MPAWSLALDSPLMGEMCLLSGDGGLFTTAQARAVGFDRRALQSMVAGRVLDRVCRGVYAPHEPDLGVEEAHLRVARAGLLLYPDAALSHVSAVLAHGLPLFSPHAQRATLVRAVGKEVLTQSFRLRPIAGSTVSTAHGPAVPPATAIVQHTLDAGPLPGVVAADRAIHEGLLDMDELAAAADLVAGWPRSGRVRTMLSLIDGRSESVGETRLRVLLAVAGIRVVPQVAITDEAGETFARVDFLVEGTKVIVEFDGKVKYSEGGPEALFAEKRREDRLRRRGYLFVRVTWSDLDHPTRILAWIRQALAAA